MPKHIREARFGPPKTFKTGSVVGTYPRPMLVLELDSGGLDCIPQTSVVPQGYLKLDVTAKDVTHIKAADFPAWLLKEQKDQPPILNLDMSRSVAAEINLMYAPQPDLKSFPEFINVMNAIIRHHTAKGSLPWKTVVLDNTTALSDRIYGHLAGSNPNFLADARKWAPAIGQKVAAVIQEMTLFPCHVVILMHEQTDKNEITGEIRTEAMIYSTYRQIVGGQVSSFFYQKRINGVPRLDTTDKGYCKGIGPRWPLLPSECGVTFNDVYGESVKNGEIVL